MQAARGLKQPNDYLKELPPLPPLKFQVCMPAACRPVQLQCEGLPGQLCSAAMLSDTYSNAQQQPPPF